MQLDITEEQRQELVKLVQQAYSDVNPEIRRAMGHEYRAELHAQRLRLQELLALLETSKQPVIL